VVAVIVIVVLLVVVVGYFFLTYNGLIGLKNRSEEAFSDIDTQLKRRHDLVPRLNDLVRAYAEHENDAMRAAASFPRA